MKKLNQEGPDLTLLTHRLTNCPAEFLKPALMQKSDGTVTGEIHTGAVVSDLLEVLGGESLKESKARPFRMFNTKHNKNRMNIILICCYLFYSPWFREERRFADAVYDFLKSGLRDIAKIIPAEQFVQDPERREELVRLCLSALGLRPGGESEAQALDRLTTVDSIERKRVILETRKAQKRARELREAMARKKAREAASKITRE